MSGVIGTYGPARQATDVGASRTAGRRTWLRLVAPPPRPIAYEERAIRTPDGFDLTLFRQRPVGGGADRYRRPVVLLPGAGANRFTFGLTPAVSLAGELSARGRDVWLVEWRGFHSSRWCGRGAPPIDVDKKLCLDLPAAVRHIRGRTGAAQLDFVGHSLGGLFVYLYGGGPGRDVVDRAVTLCAPADFDDFLGPLTWLWRRPARLFAGAAARLPGLFVPKLAEIRGPVPHLFSFVGHMRPGVLDAEARRSYMTHCVEDVPGGDLAQIMRWMGEREITSNAGHPYRPQLERFVRPVLALAAAKDGVVPLRPVREAFAAVASEEKRFTLVGRQQGARCDYAHADLLLASSARRDVYQPIADWLCR